MNINTYSMYKIIIGMSCGIYIIYKVKHHDNNNAKK